MNRAKISKAGFVVSLMIFSLLYGVYSGISETFPYPSLMQAYQAALNIAQRFAPEKNLYFKKTDYTDNVPRHKPDLTDDGLTLMTCIEQDRIPTVKVINMKGETVHCWKLSWFELWPNASHIPQEDLPKFKPGTHVHGCVLMGNGDLIFNFEHLGLVRVDVCGRVVWKLPYRTHHSVFLDKTGNLWVSGQINYYTKVPGFHCFNPTAQEPTIEPTVLKVSPQGEILSEIRIFELLKENNLSGLLVLSTLDNDRTRVTGDVLHLNDVKVFEGADKAGFFKKGDIAISLRNINAVFVFDPDTRKIKYKSIGNVVRQHDPDFVDANTISVFDNNNIALDKKSNQSRIVMLSPLAAEDRVYYQGTTDDPFFTHIMGKHQWLKNGNLLVTESMKGRVFEIDRNGDIVWEFINIIDDGYVGIVEEATRLSSEYTHAFFEQLSEKCDQSKSIQD
ncbi:MAG: arylsulfotransferase family protein [candidate division KSB1 bacterium]|nr:arylsulfotransferase family protein [candidate division KSB1 bacterium]